MVAIFSDGRRARRGSPGGVSAARGRVLRYRRTTSAPRATTPPAPAGHPRRARTPADCTVRSAASGRLAGGHEGQRLVEVVVRELPDEVESALADGRVDLPRERVVQLAELLLVAHQPCLPAGAVPAVVAQPPPPVCAANAPFAETPATPP